MRKFSAVGVILLTVLGATATVLAAAQEQAEPNEAQLDQATAVVSSDQGTERTALNLLGEVDVGEGEARRNENVRITLIDNNVLRELTARMGTTATVPADHDIERRYFASEFGQPPKRVLSTTFAPAKRAHGQLRWNHQNSVTSARSFFQVGGVLPAHDNSFGFTYGMPLWNGAAVTLDGSLVRARGNVNGNVLVPAADERTPLAVDPATRAFVQRILDAYPNELPNRTDINPRALNTNDLQSINNDRGSIRVHQAIGNADQVVLQYAFTGQKVDAFQLVGGQNPDTTTKNHVAKAGWNRSWSPGTSSDFTVGLDRVGSLLVGDETSVGPLLLTGFVVEFLGPSSNIPIDRAVNRYQYAASLKHVRGDHTWTFGAELTRRQVNGYEAESHRGLFAFRNDFGRDAITNLRLGAPSVYRIAIGNVHRGFRNWDMQYYVGDRWRLSDSWSLTLGLRYEPVTSPSEVQGLTAIPYDCDCNNLAPRFGFAYRLGRGLGIWRGSYGVQYGEIFPVTYGQARFTPPANLNINLQAPDLINPLGRLHSSDLDPNARSTVFLLDPELATPYSHLYGISWQIPLAGELTLDLGYVGSRTHKLLTLWYINRAQPVQGIPQTTHTVNLRRPDPRFFDNRLVLNGSRGYFDAAKAVLSMPHWKGLTLEASYWWSKALDLGNDFSGTASGRSGRLGRSQSEFNSHAEMRGVSSFDQPHALLVKSNWRSPDLRGLTARVFGGWQLSTVLLAKSGTPFNVIAGSDSPGFGNVDGSPGDRPNLLDPRLLGRAVDDPDTSMTRLPSSAFAFIRPTDRAGNLGRNVFRKDGIFNINMALSKQWALVGDTSLLVRAESLNLFNHPQFAEPGRQLTSPNFGQITNTLNDGRAFRIGVELGF